MDEKINISLDYGGVQSTVGELCRSYPLTGYTLARSAVGRAITAVAIGTGRPVIIASAFHGSEWLTAGVALRFARRLCQASQSGGDICGISAEEILTKRRVIIIPQVNPDGCEIAQHGAQSAGKFAGAVARLSAGDTEHWNANARGVDINHNFDAGWERLRCLEQAAGIFGPSPRRYGGKHPASEPESGALVRLCRSIPLHMALALHSQGEELYWHYGSHTPTESAMLARVLAAACEYSLEAPTGLASHGGFKDWVIDSLHLPAFTAELGRGENPLPVSDLDSIYNRVEPMLALFCVL